MGFFRGRRNLDFDVKSLVDQEDLLHLDARGNHYPHVLGLRDMTHRVIPDLSDWQPKTGKESILVELSSPRSRYFQRLLPISMWQPMVV